MLSLYRHVQSLSDWIQDQGGRQAAGLDYIKLFDHIRLGQQMELGRKRHHNSGTARDKRHRWT